MSLLPSSALPFLILPGKGVPLIHPELPVNHDIRTPRKGLPSQPSGAQGVHPWVRVGEDGRVLDGAVLGAVPGAEIPLHACEPPQLTGLSLPKSQDHFCPSTIISAFPNPLPHQLPFVTITSLSSHSPAPTVTRHSII